MVCPTLNETSVSSPNLSARLQRGHREKNGKADDGEEVPDILPSGNGVAVVLWLVEQLQVPSQGLNKAWASQH